MDVSAPQVAFILNEPLAPNDRIKPFAIVPDDSGVVYVRNPYASSVDEVCLVTFAASGSCARLDDPADPGLVVRDIVAVTPDSTSIVYLWWSQSKRTTELYRALFAIPGTRPKLNSPLGTGQQVRELALTPDGSSVVYMSSEQVNLQGGFFDYYLTNTELRRAAFPAPGSSTLLFKAVNPSTEVNEYTIMANGTALVYRSCKAFNDANVYGEQPVLYRLNVAMPGTVNKNQWNRSSNGRRPWVSNARRSLKRRSIVIHPCELRRPADQARMAKPAPRNGQRLNRYVACVLYWQSRRSLRTCPRASPLARSPFFMNQWAGDPGFGPSRVVC